MQQTKRRSVRTAHLVFALVPVLACGLGAAAAGGCGQRGGASQEKDLRNAFNDRSGFDINKLTPEQRAGYEASMKGGGGPPKADGAPPAAPAKAAPK